MELTHSHNVCISQHILIVLQLVEAWLNDIFPIWLLPDKMFPDLNERCKSRNSITDGWCVFTTQNFLKCMWNLKYGKSKYLSISA